MGLDDLASSLSVLGGQSSVFGDATKGNKIMHLARVVDNNDRSNMGRIQATIIDFNEVNGEEQPGKDKNDNVPKYAFPLIYQFVNVIPRVGELVYIFMENPKDQTSRRFYVGPIRSVNKSQKPFESTASANNLFNVNTYGKTPATNEPINQKSSPINDYVRIDGKENSNITFKSREVLITAGELKSNSFDLNTESPCYIQLKDNPAVTTTKLPKAANSPDAIKEITIQRPAFSQTNIVGTNINLISSSSSSAQNRALNDDGKLADESNVENATNPELELYGDLAKKLHPLVLGDELVKVLKLIISFCVNHKHTPQQPAYASKTEQELIDLNALLDEEGINISTILSKSVRTN
tara:strand:+ start:1942 stop:2997 length:1056 start_codon:yes stop_codon:yes gene_type:complete